MNRKSKFTQSVTALYCRLSIEDGRENESMSISNQKALLRDFAEKNGLLDYEYYVDDGYTGRNFNRPSFQRMIADIETGKVKCVITKDLSRLGRNYIEAGTYIEVFFPRHNVRYIAITDGVDSLNRQEMDITPFKNILNDLYSRDISKKVLAGWMARSRQGKFLGGPTPYGLMRDPNDHGHLIIDPETTPTVKLVFDLALNGYGTMKIAKHLLERKIPITRIKEPVESEVRYYSWSGSVIGKMLRNPVYKGDHVVCKRHQKAIRSNTVNFIPRDQWEIIENCHEAIISRDQWDRVQKLIDRRPAIMQVRYEKVGRTGKNRFTGEMREPIDKAYYICQTYNRMGKNACTSHKIEARDLYNLVLADIIEHGKMALQDAEAFYGRLTHRLEQRYSIDESSLKKEQDALAKRNQCNRRGLIQRLNKMYIEKIPPALLDDITANRCIPFIGAGFSKNANSNNGVRMPDWKELGERVSNYMLNSEFDSAVEALSQYENLYSRANLIEILAKELHVNEVFPGETHLSFCRLYFDIIVQQILIFCWSLHLEKFILNRGNHIT